MYLILSLIFQNKEYATLNREHQQALKELAALKQSAKTNSVSKNSERTELTVGSTPSLHMESLHVMSAVSTSSSSSSSSLAPAPAATNGPSRNSKDNSAQERLPIESTMVERNFKSSEPTSTRWAESQCSMTLMSALHARYHELVLSLSASRAAASPEVLFFGLTSCVC